ncbi:MAG: 50S ribosomal protein L4 [Desulfohalobiaceae bacterium]|nr:50S ribosomal protein L4 [Desulfohalobiaceae bacterium]
MSAISLFDQQSNSLGEYELPEDIFNVPVKPEILNSVVKAHLAAGRLGTVSYKNRANIRGGGKKPWRQKGTGRARAGTVRSPLWAGGAVIHGPKPRAYAKKVNRKTKRLALKMALSGKYRDSELILVDRLSLDRPKTRDFAEIQNSFQLNKPLIVVSKKDTHLDLATRNIPGVKLVTAENVNTYDILKYEHLVLTTESVEKIKERLQ